MSKFDKYFILRNSSATEHVSIDNLNIKVYDHLGNEWLLCGVEQFIIDNDRNTVRKYHLRGNYTIWATSNENDIVLEEELTKLGRLLYV